MEDLCCCTTMESQIAVNPSLLGVVESIVEVPRAITHQHSGPSSSAQAKSIWFKPKYCQRLRNPQLLLQTSVSLGQSGEPGSWS